MLQADDTDDAAIIRDLRAGNLAGLGILYDRYGEAVYRLALKIIGNSQEAEDLTQEVFLAFWNSKNYDGERGSILVFLLTMARSRSLNLLRKERSQQQMLQRLGVQPSNHTPKLPMERASLSELSTLLAQALQSLPENQRQIIEMAYYEGLSQSEISQQLQLPLGTVKTRSRQGLLKLRKLLQDLVE